MPRSPRTKSLKTYKKQNYDVTQIRRFLEPGPIVLISSRLKDETNIMTLGWQTTMLFQPSLVGLYIWHENHSHEMIRKSKQCVINIPEAHLLDTVVKIGNCSGREVDKFAEFGLTAVDANKVDVPLIKECYANLECRLYESKMIKSYDFFVFEVVKAHAPASPKYPRTVHYTGDGVFMISGEHVNKKKLFKPEML